MPSELYKAILKLFINGESPFTVKILFFIFFNLKSYITLFKILNNVSLNTSLNIIFNLNDKILTFEIESIVVFIKLGGQAPLSP